MTIKLSEWISLPLAESFYDVKYWNVNYQVWCFHISKIISQKNHFGILIYFWSWKFLFEIHFRLLRRNNELETKNFLKNIWHDNWRFSIWHRKRTSLFCQHLQKINVHMKSWQCHIDSNKWMTCTIIRVCWLVFTIADGFKHQLFVDKWMNTWGGGGGQG